MQYINKTVKHGLKQSTNHNKISNSSSESITRCSSSIVKSTHCQAHTLVRWIHQQLIYVGCDLRIAAIVAL